jgi:hypothetical protein
MGCDKDSDMNTDPIAEHINDTSLTHYPAKGNVADSGGHNHLLSLMNSASLTGSYSQIPDHFQSKHCLQQYPCRLANKALYKWRLNGIKAD